MSHPLYFLKPDAEYICERAFIEFLKACSLILSNEVSVQFMSVMLSEVESKLRQLKLLKNEQPNVPKSEVQRYLEKKFRVLYHYIPQRCTNYLPNLDSTLSSLKQRVSEYWEFQQMKHVLTVFQEKCKELIPSKLLSNINV